MSDRDIFIGMLKLVFFNWTGVFFAALMLIDFDVAVEATQQAIRLGM